MPRGPAAILFISRNTCSDRIAKLFRTCFHGASSHTIIARYVAKWGTEWPASRHHIASVFASWVRIAGGFPQRERASPGVLHRIASPFPCLARVPTHIASLPASRDMGHSDGVSHRCACVKLRTRGGGCIAPFWGSANLPQKVSRDVGCRLVGPSARRPPLSRYRASLYLSHLCFSGIRGYRAIAHQICPIATN